MFFPSSPETLGGCPDRPESALALAGSPSGKTIGAGLTRSASARTRQRSAGATSRYHGTVAAVVEEGERPPFPADEVEKEGDANAEEPAEEDEPEGAQAGGAAGVAVGALATDAVARQRRGRGTARLPPEQPAGRSPAKAVSHGGGTWGASASTPASGARAGAGRPAPARPRMPLACVIGSPPEVAAPSETIVGSDASGAPRYRASAASRRNRRLAQIRRDPSPTGTVAARPASPPPQ